MGWWKLLIDIALFSSKIPYDKNVTRLPKKQQNIFLQMEVTANDVQM